MARQFRTPNFGEFIAGAVVAKWYTKQGEFVMDGQVIVELETDKVIIEVPAPHSGVIDYIAAAEGSTVVEGSVLGAIRPYLGPSLRNFTPDSREYQQKNWLRGLKRLSRR